MTSNPFVPPLRKHLEVWEREAAAQWQTLIRSPHILRRVGNQVNRTLESQQRIRSLLVQSTAAGHGTDPLPPADTITRIQYLLERVEAELGALAMRIERLESKLSDE